MTVTDKQLSPLGPWPAGIDNRSREQEVLRSEDGKAISALREAVNTDLSARGTPMRRPGYRRIVECTRAHSLWRDGHFPFALFVDGATMYALPVGGEPFEVRDGLAYQEVSYALVGDRTFWSNGTDIGVIRSDGTAGPIGVPAPAGQPFVAATVAGDKRWQVAVTYRDARGEESGTGEGALALGATETSLTLSAIPQPTDPAVVSVRVYVSPPDGDVLYAVRDLPVGMTSATIDPRRRGIPLATQFLEPMPAGRWLRAINGRLFSAAGNVLVWSESLRYGQTRLATNRIRIGADIRMLEPVGEGTDGAGVYVADGVRTYWLGGNDPALFTRQIVAGESVIAGTGIRVPGGLLGFETEVPVAYWINSLGEACAGLPGGVVVKLRPTTAVAPLADQGASYLRNIDGVSRIVTALSGADQNPLAVTDRASARVYRNGVEV